MSKKKEGVEERLKNLEKSMSVKDYESKVPEDVKQANKEKLSQTKGELERIAEALRSLQQMSIKPSS